MLIDMMSICGTCDLSLHGRGNKKRYLVKWNECQEHNRPPFSSAVFLRTHIYKSAGNFDPTWRLQRKLNNLFHGISIKLLLFPFVQILLIYLLSAIKLLSLRCHIYIYIYIYIHTYIHTYIQYVTILFVQSGFLNLNAN